jgi:hypothetical protein
MQVDLPKELVVVLLRIKSLEDRLDAAVSNLEQLLVSHDGTDDGLCARCGEDRDEVAMQSQPTTYSLKADTADLFAKMTAEYLKGTDYKCAVIRFAGYWTHVSDRGHMTGHWDEIEEALTATECVGTCPESAFA